MLNHVFFQSSFPLAQGGQGRIMTPLAPGPENKEGTPLWVLVYKTLRGFRHYDLMLLGFAGRCPPRKFEDTIVRSTTLTTIWELKYGGLDFRSPLALGAQGLDPVGPCSDPSLWVATWTSVYCMLPMNIYVHIQEVLQCCGQCYNYENISPSHDQIEIAIWRSKAHSIQTSSKKWESLWSVQHDDEQAIVSQKRKQVLRHGEKYCINLTNVQIWG